MLNLGIGILIGFMIGRGGRPDGRIKEVRAALAGVSGCMRQQVDRWVRLLDRRKTPH